MGGVPTLVHQGVAIAQSRAILEYLEEIHPTPALMPQSALARAQVKQICDNINCEIHPLQNLRVMQLLENKFSATAMQKQEWIQHWNHEGLKACESLLTKTAGQFSFGEELTLADVFLVPHIFSANRFKVDLSPFPTIVRINEACLKLRAFQLAHPFGQMDTPPELKNQK